MEVYIHTTHIFLTLESAAVHLIVQTNLMNKVDKNKLYKYSHIFFSKISLKVFYMAPHACLVITTTNTSIHKCMHHKVLHLKKDLLFCGCKDSRPFHLIIHPTDKIEHKIPWCKTWFQFNAKNKCCKSARENFDWHPFPPKPSER